MSDSPFQSIWLGYDSREVTAFIVATYSIRRYDRHIPIKGLVLEQLQKSGMYYRPTKRVSIQDSSGKLTGHTQIIDEISGAPNSTEFSISRFLVPAIAKTGWALYADCDIMVRRNINSLFSLADNSKAVMVVKHKYVQRDGIKMDSQIQTVYKRKNWSSVILFNCDHPSNKQLSVEYVNSVRGLDLHQFAWLSDYEIGELPPEWNYCVGHSPHIDPAIVHFTDGIPDMPGYENQEFADEWRAMKPLAARAL